VCDFENKITENKNCYFCEMPKYSKKTILLLSLSWLCLLQTKFVAAQVKGSIDTLVLHWPAPISARLIYVWKPKNYNPAIKYNTLYMHDGQMLFDAKSTWNHKEWRVDEVADSLMKAKACAPFIVVGIGNDPATRYRDYYPREAFNRLSVNLKQIITDTGKYDMISNYYLQAIKDLVIPEIEKRYAVNTTAASRCIAGSSMGGLISWYAVTRYPSMFRAAICMSTHWPGGDPRKYGDTLFNAFRAVNTEYLKDRKRTNTNTMFYFDHGGKTLDSFYTP
jgi:enterochelin esterase-like enzyme